MAANLGDISAQRYLTKAYEIVPIIKRAKVEFEKDSALINRFECLRNC